MKKKIISLIGILIVLIVCVCLGTKGKTDVMVQNEILTMTRQHQKGIYYIITELSLPVVTSQISDAEQVDSIFFDGHNYRFDKKRYSIVTTSYRKVQDTCPFLTNKGTLLMGGQEYLVVLDEDGYSFIERKGEQWGETTVLIYALFNLGSDEAWRNVLTDDCVISEKKQSFEETEVQGRTVYFISGNGNTLAYVMDNEVCYVLSCKGEKNDLISYIENTL